MHEVKNRPLPCFYDLFYPEILSRKFSIFDKKATRPGHNRPILSWNPNLRLATYRLTAEHFTEAMIFRYTDVRTK